MNLHTKNQNSFLMFTLKLWLDSSLEVRCKQKNNPNVLDDAMVTTLCTGDLVAFEDPPHAEENSNAHFVRLSLRRGHRKILFSGVLLGPKTESVMVEDVYFTKSNTKKLHTDDLDELWKILHPGGSVTMATPGPIVNFVFEEIIVP